MTTMLAEKAKAVSLPAWSTWSLATFTEAKYDKPVMNYTEFITVVPEVRVEPVLDRFFRSLDFVVREAGRDHVCLMRGGIDKPGPMFRYVHEGKGDCIMGRILIHMGVSPEAFAPYEGHPAHHVVEALWGHPALSGTSSEREAVKFFACVAQSGNDYRHPWGVVAETVQMQRSIPHEF